MVHLHLAKQRASFKLHLFLTGNDDQKGVHQHLRYLAYDHLLPDNIDG